MKVTPIFNTAELTEYFYTITQEAFQHITFEPNTYFNVPIYRKDMSLENLYIRTGSKLAKTNNWTKDINKQDFKEDWQSEVITTHLSNGTLYKFYYDSTNSALTGDNYLHTYVFCYDRYLEEGKPYWDFFKGQYPGAKENLWFSYMHKDTGFDWHKDGDFWRYHQVLVNDGITPSFVTNETVVYTNPGEAFVEWTGTEHLVPQSQGPRLHVVGSFT